MPAFLILPSASSNPNVSASLACVSAVSVTRPPLRAMRSSRKSAGYGVVRQPRAIAPVFTSKTSPASSTSSSAAQAISRYAALSVSNSGCFSQNFVIRSKCPTIVGRSASTKSVSCW